MSDPLGNAVPTGNEQDARSLPDQVSEDTRNFIAPGPVQPHERLVQNEPLRSRQERPRDSGPANLAVRELDQGAVPKRLDPQLSSDPGNHVIVGRAAGPQEGLQGQIIAGLDEIKTLLIVVPA